MEKYSSYKDSGVQWLGQIPSHWEVKHLRNFLTLFSEKGYGDAQLLSVTREKGVILRDRDDKEENHNYVPDDLGGYKHLMPGDFVINKMKSWQGSYGVSEYEGIVSPAYFTCKLKGVDPQFFSQAIRSKAYIGFFMQYSKGIRVDQWDLDPSSMKDIPFILPPLDEQKRIVPYLDAATAKIDEAIAQQQRMIDLLNERKRIIINHAVSKGLDPNAKLKDSGIDWMGQIPEHWQVCRIKAVGKAEHGISYTPSDMTDESGTIVLRASNIQDGKLCFDDNVYVKRARSTKLLKKNDILICATNGSLSLVGKNALIDKSDCYSFGTFMLALRTSQNQNFIRYQLGRVVDNYRGLFATTTINQITQQVLGDIRVTIPPLKEQAQIAMYLDEITSKIDNAIFQQTSIINLLQERKQIIINDVVTGKVKVV